MDRLWAPWRNHYLSRKIKGKACIFCQAKKGRRRDNVVFRTQWSICLLNIYPYNNGHLLVSPLRHTGDLDLLSDEEALDLINCAKKAKRLLAKVLKPHGYNLGFNLGRQAGAGITRHLHMHIVPRWAGDTNFMPVTGKVKVISQSLDELSGRLKKAQLAER